MREFFRGWRRKVGVGTLLLACLISAAWGFSTHVYALVDHHFGDWQYHALSYDGKFALWRYKPNDWVRKRRVQLIHCWGANRSDLDNYRITIEAQKDVYSRRFAACGFSNQGRENEIGPTEFMEFTVPYWQPILPLTLLSACLILWKPRQRTGTSHA